MRGGQETAPGHTDRGEAALAQAEANGTSPMIIETMLNRCAKETGIAPREILGRSRTAEVSRSRCATMWAARKVLSPHTRGSYPALGRVFRRDHSTVIHAVRKAEARRTAEIDFRRLTDALVAGLF
jgi:chromosomal replication initiation ATPase DnaA